MNYTFTNKNKRNKDKLLCKNFSKYQRVEAKIAKKADK